LIESILHPKWAFVSYCKRPFKITPFFIRVNFCKMDDWSVLVGQNLTRNFGKRYFKVKGSRACCFDTYMDYSANVRVIFGSE
jgi:hypothetical protein